MTYWLLTTEYPPFFGGGISTYGYFTARMLAAKGHSVSVFVNDASVADISVEATPNIRIIRFNPDRSKAPFLGHVTAISYGFAHVVKHFIELEGPPDVIESQEYLGIAYYLLQYKHLQYDWCRNIPVLITMHSPSFLYLEYNHVPLYRYPNYWIGEMERFCLQAADLLVSPSQYILQEVKKRFALTNPNIAIIPNPYEISRQTVGSSEAEEPEQIVFYGKLSAQKGTFELLRYFRELWKEGFSKPLYLIGGQDIIYHPEGRMMGDIVRTQNKEYIQKGLLVLEDQIAPQEIRSRLARAKVVIVPSVVENLPYVVFEMMELGKSLLVSKQGGHAEVIDNGINGFIFDHKEPESFARQLEAILGKTNDERKRIGEKGYEKLIRHYSFDAIYPIKLEAIDKILDKEGNRQQYPFIRAVTAKVERSGPVNNLLSIVVPFYNMGSYVDETIQSLQQVDYLEKEIIIVNDGSTDEDSLRKLEQYRSTPGIRVVDTPNRGLSSARNTGAEEASGSYLAFLDADDRVHANYYSKAIKVLRHKENVAFVGCWVQYFEDSEKIWPTFTPEPPLILYHNLVNSSALVYRRSEFLAYGRNDVAMRMGLEDYESVIALAEKGKYGVVLPEVLFHYRVRRNSMARGISRTKKIYLFQYISNKHKGLYTNFAAEIFNLLNANGPGTVLDNPSLDFHLSDNVPFNNRVTVMLIKLIKRNRLAKKIAYRVYRIINK
jgi:glycosyltransferase involved in cell wall biosynthesis